MKNSIKLEELLLGLLQEYADLIDNALYMLENSRKLMTKLLELRMKCAKLMYATYDRYGQGLRIRTPRELQELEDSLALNLAKSLKKALKRSKKG